MSSSFPLPRAQRNPLEGLLQSQLQALERQTASHLEGLSQVDHAQLALQQDADDASQRAGDHEFESAVSDHHNRTFDEVTRALHRIHGADYGFAATGNAIAFSRLSAQPKVTRCVSCQSIEERKPFQ